MGALHLSEEDLAFIQEQVAAGTAPTPEHFVSELIRAEQRRRAKEMLEAAAIKGIESGAPTLITPEFWDSVRNRVRARIAQQDPRP